MHSIPSILLALSTLPSGGQAAASEMPVPSQCALPEGWSQVAGRGSRYVVFGELHGTHESPAFVGDLACALASRNRRVLVAVELDSTIDGALQEAWKQPVSRFKQALGAAGWQGRKDGVGSEAMFAMLVRLHALKEAGLPIGVAAFNGTRDEAQQKRFPDLDLAGQGPHEAAQAENIKEAAALARYDQVLVLAGSFHAERTRYGEGANSFDPMAVRLASFGTVTSLKMRYAAGTSWDCNPKPGMRFEPGQTIPEDAIECGNHRAKGDADLFRAPFMQLGAFPGEDRDARFDGFFWLGPISGSPPQVPE